MIRCYVTVDYINWLPVAILTQQCRVFNDIFFFLTAAYLWRCQMMLTWVFGSDWSFFNMTELVIPCSLSTNIPVNIVPSLYPRQFPHNHPPPAALLEQRQASFVQVLSFSSTILILNIAIPSATASFRMNSSHMKRKCIGKTPFLLLQQQMFLVLTELLMWLLVNSWLNYLQRIYSPDAVLWTKEQRK